MPPMPGSKVWCILCASITSYSYFVSAVMCRCKAVVRTSSSRYQVNVWKKPDDPKQKAWGTWDYLLGVLQVKASCFCCRSKPLSLFDSPLLHGSTIPLYYLCFSPSFGRVRQVWWQFWWTGSLVQVFIRNGDTDSAQITPLPTKLPGKVPVAKIAAHFRFALSQRFSTYYWLAWFWNRHVFLQ